MKAIFETEVAVKPRKGIDGVTMQIEAEIPFIPTKGMMLSVVDGDDFRKVDDVYWSEREGLRVFFKFDRNARVDFLANLGWREEK